MLTPSLQPGDIVVMDNLSAHKVQGIESTIEETGAKLLFLPPYSPVYSPIEHCMACSGIKQAFLEELAVFVVAENRITIASQDDVERDAFGE